MSLPCLVVKKDPRSNEFQYTKVLVKEGRGSQVAVLTRPTFSEVRRLIIQMSQQELASAAGG
jgi:hypothetical protein